MTGDMTHAGMIPVLRDTVWIVALVISALAVAAPALRPTARVRSRAPPSADCPPLGTLAHRGCERPTHPHEPRSTECVRPARTTPVEDRYSEPCSRCWPRSCWRSPPPRTTTATTTSPPPPAILIELGDRSYALSDLGPVGEAMARRAPLNFAVTTRSPTWEWQRGPWLRRGRLALMVMAVGLTFLAVTALLILGQPMEMRGNTLGPTF